MSAQYGKVNERMSDNVQQLQSIFSQAPDLIFRSVDTPNGPEAMLVYFDGLVDLNSINNHVLYPLIEGLSSTEYSLPVTVGHVESTSAMSQVEKMLLNGKSVLFLPGSSEAYIFDTCGWPQRSIIDRGLRQRLPSRLCRDRYPEYRPYPALYPEPGAQNQAIEGREKRRKHVIHHVPSGCRRSGSHAGTHKSNRRAGYR